MKFHFINTPILNEELEKAYITYIWDNKLVVFVTSVFVSIIYVLEIYNVDHVVF